MPQPSHKESPFPPAPDARRGFWPGMGGNPRLAAGAKLKHPERAQAGHKRHPAPPPASLVGALVMAVILVASIAGCGSKGAEYEHVYTVRGRVLQLPDGTPGGGFVVYHEEIPDYAAANGTTGMHAMAMPFALPDPSVIDGLAVGDIVEITFGESFKPEVRQGVIKAVVLPPDTVLAFDEDTDDAGTLGGEEREALGGDEPARE